MNPAQITAVVLTRNEERKLARALSSLPAGTKVLVVDSHSTDATLEIARSAGAQVVQRDWRGFLDARTYALGIVQTPWTLMLDADEELDETLRASICAAAEDADGYAFLRTTYFAGRPLRIWRNEPVLRLFRTDRARLRTKAMTDKAEVHEVWSVPGVVRPLAGELRHFSYDDRESYRAKYERYTDLEAAAVRFSPARARSEQFKRFPRFLALLVLRGALLDGPLGWYVAWNSAAYRSVVLRKAQRLA